MVFRLFFLSFVNLQVYCSYSCSYFPDCDVRTEYVNENDICMYIYVGNLETVLLILEVVL